MESTFSYFLKLRRIKKEKKQSEKLIKQLEKDNKKKENRIKKKIKKISDENLIQTLKNMDVETLNFDKSGIRVSALKNYGIKNVYQVSKMKIKKLLKIPGIGEKNAKLIYKNAKIIKNKLKENSSFTIDPDKKSKDNLSIVKESYQINENKNIIGSLKSNLRNNETEYRKLYSNAKTINNPIAMLFASKERKEEIYNSINELEKFTYEKYSKKVLEEKNKTEEVKRVNEKDTWDEFKNNSAKTYTTLEKINIGKSTISKKYSGIPNELANEIEKEKLNLENLKVTLRPYQEFGTKYILHQEKVLLGDEMGLGKTMQAIAVMCHLKSLGKTHFLVVAPLSVLINWIREVSKNSDLNVIKIYGDDYEAKYNEWNQNGGVAVTTYETCKKISDYNLPLINFLCVDEAHYVKNPEAQRTQALLKVKENAERILFMTGTPLENNVDEMNFLVNCLQSNVARELESLKSISRSEEYKQKVAPVYLRRVREDVLTELPELIEKEEWVTLNKKEIEKYKLSLKDKNFMSMRHVSWNTDDINDSSKAERLFEICNEARDNGRKVLVFTYFKETIEKVKLLLGDRCMTPITGAVPASKRQEIIDEFSKREDGAVLICQVLAGGVGLNIQSASVVVFCEPQLKPSMETQAIARSYRMGQSRSVLVHRLLADETVDERILDILKEKSDIFESFADDSVIANENKKISQVENLIKEQQEYWGKE